MPAHNTSKIPLGTVLEGKFRLTREIGRGGMAAVYEAENVDIGKRVAVKILAAELITSRVVRERFLREARAAAAIRSPYICDVYDSGMFEERPFLVMELLEGESLYDMMTRVRRLDIDTTRIIATQVARGLQKAHEGNIVHRDLKPENIFLTRDEEGQLLAKILDFGLAKFYEPEMDPDNVRLTREGALFGTPAYMSPEQAKGQGAVDHRADLWALACIVYECLTGRTVWNVEQGVAMILAQIANSPTPQPSHYRPDLPATFDAWFERALNRDPKARIQTAKEFADSLGLALTPAEGFLAAAGEAGHGGADAPAVPVQVPVGEDVGGADNTQPMTASVPAGAPHPARGTHRGTQSKSSASAILWLFAFAAVALGGYALWLYVLNPPPERTESRDVVTKRLEKTLATAKPLETEPYALQIQSAQDWLQKRNHKNALAMFKEAFKNGGKDVARSLLSHATVAVEEAGDKCKVTGLSRPRPFDLSQAASRPSIAFTEFGLVFVWADNHQDNNRTHAFSILLDSALRRVTPPQLITPESTYVHFPKVLKTDKHLAFIYWDSGGKEPGVYVRLLDHGGRIASPARRISAIKRLQFYPSLARTPDGNYWAVWEEEQEDKATDLIVRKLNEELEPLGEPVRLTAMTPNKNHLPSGASYPDIAVTSDHLNVVFSLSRHPKNHQVILLRTKLDNAQLRTGTSRAKAPKITEEEAADVDTKQVYQVYNDAYVGEVHALGESQSKHAQPRISCFKDGCFTVWDNLDAGAHAAFFEPGSDEPLWHREFAPRGSRPAIPEAEDGQLAVVWYESNRVKVATLSRNGVGHPSVLSRVNGLQPYASVVRGDQPGQWYAAWRDFEAGHFEAFLVRAQCQ